MISECQLLLLTVGGASASHNGIATATVTDAITKSVNRIRASHPHQRSTTILKSSVRDVHKPDHTVNALSLLKLHVIATYIREP